MLRAIAALAVVLHHTLEQSNGAKTAFSPDWLTTFGASGIDVFFVISGFIMLYTSFRPGHAPILPGAFLFRRATRIYPLYWVCCLVMLVIMGAGFMHHNRLTPSEIALSLVLLPSAKLIIGVSWTLTYEAYFYIVFAVTLLFRSVLVSAIGTTVLIAIVGLAGGTLGKGALQDFFANPIPCEFALGLWIAVAFTRSVAAGRRWAVPAPLGVLSFVFLALAPLLIMHRDTIGLPGWPRVLAWGLPAALIVAWFLSLAAPTNRFQLLMVLLGDASYALYLTHPFVMIGYGLILHTKAVSQAPQIVIVPVIVLLAIAVGVAAHLAIENPLFRLIRRWTRRGLLVSEAAAHP
jgi:peptidoglycan/LPS O-acetylase OafA/YrhL